MDWKTLAIDKLKEYTVKRQSLEILPMEIAELESTMTSIKSSSSGASVSAKGGGVVRNDDMLLSCIVKIEELQRNLDQAKLWIKAVDKGLAILDPTERNILDRFYISPARGNVDRMCEELFVEKSTLYKRKDVALRKFTIALYGCTES